MKHWMITIMSALLVITMSGCITSNTIPDKVTKGYTKIGKYVTAAWVIVEEPTAEQKTKVYEVCTTIRTYCDKYDTSENFYSELKTKLAEITKGDEKIQNIANAILDKIQKSAAKFEKYQKNKEFYILMVGSICDGACSILSKDIEEIKAEESI